MEWSSVTPWSPPTIETTVPNARILRYGYKSMWCGADAIRQNSSLVAHRLLLALRRERKEFPFRPLIFLAHCFGGLAVLKALLEAYHDTKEWKGIFQSTTGLVFFGTPFRGAEGTSQSEMLQAALSEYERDEVHPEVLNILDPGNELLQDLVDGFGKTRSLPNKAHVACFFELQPSNVGAIVGKQRKKRFVVSESSGCLDVSEATEKYSLERSHFNMNKFGKPTEEDFLTVSEVVEKMVKSSPELLLARSKYQDKHHVPFSLKNLQLISRFVERAQEMRAIEDYFLPEKQAVTHSLTKRKTFLLHGLGGMGKTQLATAFARKHHDRFSAVLWFDGSSIDRLKQSFVAIACELPRNELMANVAESLEVGKVDTDVVVRGVLTWLSLPSNKHWLLILDNVDRDWNTTERDPLAYNAREYFPRADHGSILVTSRLMSIVDMFEANLHVGRVDDVQARSILEVNAHKKLEDAQIMIDKLDRLPLALTQAGAYLRETNISVASYIKHYDNTWKNLMEDQGRYALREYGDRSSILTTWMISYKQVASESEGAANLLKLWGFLVHQDLWYSLISPVIHYSPDLKVPKWLSKLAEHEIQFDNAIRILRRYSLIDAAEQHTESHAVHAVLHAWCHCLSIGNEQRIMLLLAITIVACAVPPESEVARWRLQRRLLPHGMYVHSRLNMLRGQHGWTSEDEDNIPGWTDHTLGRLFAHQTKLPEAEMLLKRALSRSEKALGGEDMTTLGVMNDLGNLLSRQGKLAEAEEMYKRSLAGKEKVFGAEHTDTLSTLYNLANLSCKQCKLVEAESMYEQVLVGYEKALGPDHLSTLTTVNSLGSLYVDRDKLAEAEVMNKRALAGKEKALGSEHPETLGTIDNLGNVFFKQGKLAEAEALLERALVGKEKTFGREHEDTLKTVNNLSIVYSNHGKLEEAVLMSERALAGYERALDKEHIDTLSIVNNLGTLYSAQGKLVEAEAMYTRALAGREKVLGAEHRDTLNTVNNLGNLYARQGKLAEAEAMLKRALSGYDKVLEAEHTDTIRAVHNLGALHELQGKLAEAEAMYKRALAGYEKVLGPEHADTLSSVNTLGNLYEALDKLGEAQEMYERALTGREKVLGEEHPDTLQVLNNLGLLHKRQGKLAEAESVYKRALACKERALGAENKSTLGTAKNLGNLFWIQGKLAEAEAIYKRVLAGYETAFGTEHTNTLSIVNDLGNLHYAHGKPAEAEVMYKRALAGYEKTLGTEHPDTFSTICKLGALYFAHGKFTEVEAIYHCLLIIYDKTLGPEHVLTVTTVSILSNIYLGQGKLAEAEEMFERALLGYEKVLGSEHKNTLETVNSFGIVYQAQGKLVEAEEVYDRALAGREKMLGLEHADTLTTVNNLGDLYQAQDRLGEAETMFERALAGRERVLGPEHTNTLITAGKLGILYFDQGKLAEWKAMSTRVLAGKEKVAGAERTGTFGTAGIISALCHIASNITTGFRWLGLPVPDLYSIRRWTSRLRDLCG